MTFECEAEGYPAPQIKWVHNGKPIEKAPFNPRRTVTSNSITIVNLTKQDTGNYGCNASSERVSNNNNIVKLRAKRQSQSQN